MKHFLKDSDEVLKELNTTENGLTSEEAQKREEKYGKNKLQEAKKTSLIKRFFQQLADPMIIILIVAAAISVSCFFLSVPYFFVKSFNLLKNSF